MHGVINLLKPPGMTSHDAVAFVRRLSGTRRVGHTGTLDPAAAGVLPICIGNATRLVEYLQAGDKEYIAEAVFGIETDTLDTTGEIIARHDTGAVTAEAITGVLGNFRGEIEQIPPLYSAIKQDGKRLYELARSGAQDVEIPRRKVQIDSLKMTHFIAHDAAPRAIFRIECGGGTYIRSLLRDIGTALGCGAAMSFLVRTRSGLFSIDEAQTLEKLKGGWQDALIPFADALEGCAARTVIDDEVVSEYLAGRTRRSREAEQPHRTGEFAAARLLFLNTAETHALLSQLPTESEGSDVKLLHLT